MSFLSKPVASFQQWTMPAEKKLIFTLGEGSRHDSQLLSPKGSNLCEIARMGISTPQTFILSTETAVDQVGVEDLRDIAPPLVNQIKKAIHHMETSTGSVFGSVQGSYPLMLCIRVGAPFPQTGLGMDEILWSEFRSKNFPMGMRGASESQMFPGVQETVHGIGLNSFVCENLANLTNSRFALNAYANFLMRFGCAVLKADISKYHLAISNAVNSSSGDIASSNSGVLSADDLRVLIREFKLIQEVPDNVWTQLHMVISMAYKSWASPRAVQLRHELDCTDNIAVIVQSMVYGGAGTCYSRNPITGANELVGDFCTSLGVRQTWSEFVGTNPSVGCRLRSIVRALETHFHDAQVSFTCQPSRPSSLPCINHQACTLPRRHYGVVVAPSFWSH